MLCLLVVSYLWLLVETRISLLVGTEVGRVNVQTCDGRFALECEALDRCEVGVHLGAGVAETVLAGGGSGGGRGAGLPLLGWGGDQLLVHGVGGLGSNAKDGSGGGGHEGLAGDGFGVQSNRGLWLLDDRSEGSSDGEGGEESKEGLHCVFCESECECECEARGIIVSEV